MKIAVASDLHMGNTIDVDNNKFSLHTIDNVMKFIKYLESISDRVYLAGDIWEGLKCPLKASLKKHMQVFRYVKKNNKIKYIRGNHDWAMLAYGFGYRKVIRIDDKNIYIGHGNLYDFGKSWYKFLVIPLDLLIGIIALILFPLRFFIGRLFGRFILDKVLEGNKVDDIDQIDTQTEINFEDRTEQLVQEQFLISNNVDAAALRILKNGFDAVIFGHTHEARNVRDGKKLYLNSGRSNQKHFEYVLLDTQDMSAKVCRLI